MRQIEQMNLMETYTVVLSIISLSIAMLTFGWTVYRDVVQKPKFRVSVEICSIFQSGQPPDGPHIFVRALNLGPLPNRLGIVFTRRSWWHRKIHPTEAFAFITPDHTHPACTQAGARLEVGDTGTFVFPYDKDCFLREDSAKIGITDGYGRTHWAPRTQLREVRERYRDKFVNQINAS